MSRLLVAGLSPLPFENAQMSYGPGIRTWQFAWSLARAGHEVHLLAMRAPGYDHAAAPTREARRGVSIERLSDVAFLDPSRVRRAVRDLQPDALVGASLYGSTALVPVAAGLPFWADQFGHAMAEAQAKASLEGRNWPVAHTWGFLGPVLRTADRLSVVSERQRYAAIGEMGAVGRLTAETCGYDFTAVIPCALVPPDERPPSRPAPEGRVAPRALSPRGMGAGGASGRVRRGGGPRDPRRPPDLRRPAGQQEPDRPVDGRWAPGLVQPDRGPRGPARGAAARSQFPSGQRERSRGAARPGGRPWLPASRNGRARAR